MQDHQPSPPEVTAWTSSAYDGEYDPEAAEKFVLRRAQDAASDLARMLTEGPVTGRRVAAAIAARNELTAAIAAAAAQSANFAAQPDTGDPAFDAAYGAARQALHQAGVDIADGRRETLRKMSAQIAREAATSAAPVTLAAGLGVAAGLRLGEHWRAQDAGTADAFGMDPAARLRSWAGFHDGAL